MWPQAVTNYPYQAGAEFYMAPAWDFQAGYVNWTFADESVLKTELDILNTRNFGYGDMVGPNPLAALDAVPGGYNKLNATYGRAMGEMTGGVSLWYAGKSTESTVGGATDKSSYSEIGIRLGLTLIENKLDLGLGFLTGSYSVETGGETVYEADGASTIMVSGRYWWAMNEEWTWIPSLAIASHTDNTAIGDETAEWSETTVRLGIGNNWTPADNMLVIGELGFMMDGATASDTRVADGEEVKYSDNDIFWRLGAEMMVFNWMDARIGAARNWNSMKTEMGDDEELQSSSMTATYVGASAHWNRLMFDVLVNPVFLGNGPNFVSGFTGPLLWRTSMTFKFK
jgi:hypothetical protein